VLVGAAATGALATHLVATVLFNTPDSFNLDLRRHVGGWSIPGWRFFAPNPGTQNVHLLVRDGEGENAATNSSDWRDVTPVISHRAWNVLFNARSRGPKALFDAMQQLSVMKANYSEFSWVVKSTPYELVADAVRGLTGEVDAPRFQFLLMNYFPSAPHQQKMQPLLVSEWESRW
jgi:hypothetical protein